jgi:microcystin-dependent protein
MSDQFLAEIRIFAFNFAPRGWAQCNGQIMPIQQNTALFSLLGTTYGGNGTSNFGLPNLTGSIPLHIGRNQPGPGLQIYDLGQIGGSQNVTLLQAEIPIHNHPPVVSSANSTVTVSAGNQPAKPFKGSLSSSSEGLLYTSAAPGTQVSPQAITPQGGNTAHNNMMPTLVLNYCIALQGNFPARN